MESYILNNDIDENVEGWDLAMIAWGYSYINEFNTEKIMLKIKNGIEDRFDEMNVNEMLISLRAYVV